MSELLSRSAWQAKMERICEASRYSLHNIDEDYARCIKGVVGVGSLGAGPDDSKPPRKHSNSDLEVITDTNATEYYQGLAARAFLAKMEEFLNEEIVLDYADEPFTSFGPGDTVGVDEICKITRENGEHEALSILYVRGATVLLTSITDAAKKIG